MAHRSLGAALLGLSLAALFASCMLPFEDLDPREGDATTTPGGSAGATSSTSSPTGGGGAGNAGGSGNTGGTGNSGGIGNAGGGGGDGGAGGATVLVAEYAATIAECVNPATPNPDVCENEAGIGNLEVDLQAGSSPYHVNQSYVRFDLDDAIAGRTVLGITLRLTVTNATNADSTNSGEVWTSAAFDLAALSVFPAPATIERVAVDLGDVVLEEVVDFDLTPTSIVTASTPLYLALMPTSTNAVNYWNLSGLYPPQLIVAYQ